MVLARRDQYIPLAGLIFAETHRSLADQSFPQRRQRFLITRVSIFTKYRFVLKRLDFVTAVLNTYTIDLRYILYRPGYNEIRYLCLTENLIQVTKLQQPVFALDTDHFPFTVTELTWYKVVRVSFHVAFGYLFARHFVTVSLELVKGYSLEVQDT